MQPLAPDSHSSRGPLIVFIIGVILIVGGLIAVSVWGVASFSQPRPIATQPIETAQPIGASTNPSATNRIAVIDQDQIYTIDPSGGNQASITTNGSVPTGALIWSRDGTRLIYAATTASGSQLISVAPDDSSETIVYEAERARVPFYLYGSPDDQHVAFLQSDPDANSLNLQLTNIAPTPTTQSIAIGQPDYYSWSPQSDALLLHVGGTSRAAFVGTYHLGAAAPQNINTQPALFQTPMWSPIDQRLLYARQYLEGGQLIVGDGARETAVITFNVGLAFSWSPDAKHIAYTDSNPVNFTYNSLSIIDTDGQAAHQYFGGDLLAFFWSPDGSKLAYLTGALIEPGPVGKAGGLAAPRIDQQALRLTWHVIDLQTQQTINLTSFEPSDSFVFLVQYFDQFAQSIELWSPDSRSLVFTGTDFNGQSGVYVIDATKANSTPAYLGSGDFAIWSWK
jgi:TolB protein